MANRCLLHRNKLADFEAWLRRKGCQLRKPQGYYELLRWVGVPNRPMPIIFDRLKGDHLTLNSSAEKYVREWLKSPSPFASERTKALYDNDGNIIAWMPSSTFEVLINHPEIKKLAGDNNE